MKAFGMELRRDHAARIKLHRNSSENSRFEVWVGAYSGAWICCAELAKHPLAQGSGVTADEAIANCESDARRNHAALAELLERMK